MTYANKEKSAITSKLFPRLIGILANLRKFSVNDAQDIASLMKYDISKYLYEVPCDGIAKFNRAYSDFESLSALHFAIEYKSMSEPSNSLKTITIISNISVMF